MKAFLKKQEQFTRIEFWAFTTLFVFILFFFITDALDGSSAAETAPFRRHFEKANVPFSYYSHYFIPQFIRNIFLYLSFCTLNFWVIPKLVKREGVLQNILFFMLIFLVAGVVFGITDSYMRAYLYAGRSRDETDQEIFLNSFEYCFTLLMVLVVYSSIKYTALFLFTREEKIQSRYPWITREVLVASVLWLILQLLFILGDAETEIIAAWAIVVPNAIAFYALSIHNLLPRSMRKKRPLISYLIKSVLITGLCIVPVSITLLLALKSEEGTFNLIFFNMNFQMFITVPVTWVLYRRKIRGNEVVSVLQKELKQSTASMDFLRSQINPHFLFNALNTLYGTALQENAERTSEGIQRLGDMMRFMLMENLQESISLSREIEYLENYISLQKLRTDTHSNIRIETEIPQRETPFRIAPMLLIPFVENAFKHGISFREPSPIKMTLEIRENTLYFDVYNRKHPKQEHDPEKDKSGIGLENVRQRLKLLYPTRHELIIRETTREFFVHLTLQLK